MAARPNTVRTLEYGHRLATNHAKRLRETITMAERVITDNHLLTKEDIASYKECIRIAKRQLAFYEKATSLSIPQVKLSTRRKRGRPSKAELAALEAQRKNQPAAKATTRAAKAAPAKAAPTKAAKAKPAKATVAVQGQTADAHLIPAQPKRRGRPPKNPVVAAPAPVAQPKRRGRPPKAKPAEAAPVVAAPAATPKRRGRPPKVRTETSTANGMSGHSVPAEAATSSDVAQA